MEVIKTSIRLDYGETEKHSSVVKRATSCLEY